MDNVIVVVKSDDDNDDDGQAAIEAIRPDVMSSAPRPPRTCRGVGREEM